MDTLLFFLKKDGHTIMHVPLSKANVHLKFENHESKDRLRSDCIHEVGKKQLKARVEGGL